MTNSSVQWLADGTGRPPSVRWSFVLDAPLQMMDLSSEAGTLLAADQSGGMYLLDRMGKILSMTHGFQEIRNLAFTLSKNTQIPRLATPDCPQQVVAGQIGRPVQRFASC